MKDFRKRRFCARIKFTMDPDACWLWQGAEGGGWPGSRYGTIGKRYAHRVMYEWTTGPILAGLHVLHSCDVKKCVNPRHLWAGTDADNMRDKVAKNRQYKGEAHWNTKFINEDILTILSDPRSQRIIAEQYGVHRQTIQKIKTKETWKHIHFVPNSL
jgi:hypothetical protein